MQNTRTPEDRVLDSLFRSLADDPTFPKITLKRLEDARAQGKLADVNQLLEACRLAGGADATDSSS